MLRTQASSTRDQVLLDYTSPHGSTVTHLRGTVLADMQSHLRELGIYDRYMRALSAPSREQLSAVIASSWVDIAYAVEHYELLERVAADLALSEARMDEIAMRIVKRVTDTFIGSMVRATRSAGIEAFSFVMSKNDRLWDRFYMGGGCTVIQHGPKELTLENHGNPLFGLRMFRIGYDAYTHVLTKLFCKTAVIKDVRPRNARGHSMATRFSWV